MKRWFALFAILAACKSPTKHAVSKHQEAPVIHVPDAADAAFVIAKPTVTRGELPARFGAPLPATMQDLAHPVPPGSYVKGALASNTAGMRDRLLAAASRVHGVVPEEVTGWYRNALGYRVAPETCSWIVANADKVPADGRALLWHIVEKCSDPSFAEVLDRDGVPSDVIVHWYFDQLGESAFPFRERVAKAAGDVARTATEEFDVREVGFVFARMKGEESVKALAALQATLVDRKKRALIGLGMLRSDSPAGQAIGKDSCKNAAVAKDPMCEHDPAGGYDKQVKAAKTADALLELGEGREKLLEKFPKDQVLAALEKCTRTGKSYRRSVCLEDIAAIDRAAAVKLAAALQGDDDEDVARTARTLVKFPEPGALEKELVRLGFALDKAADGERTDIDVDGVLMARGRVDAFDVETDQFPNEHDELLVRLAALAKPALDDVAFEEDAPPNDEGDYQLYAYANGKRYAVTAENHGDWYDVDAVVGLLNALLVERGSPTRVVLLPTGDQTAIALAGPKQGLLELSKAGLIDFASAAASEKAGKDFEDKVFNEMTSDGGVIERDVILGK